jgi:hypothetical protein
MDLKIDFVISYEAPDCREEKKTFSSSLAFIKLKYIVV